MKKIEAIIRSDRLAIVKDKLAKQGYPALTTYEVKGRGRQSGIVQTVNGYTLYADLLPKTKVEIVIDDADVENALSAIIENTQTGTIGDGMIFISTVDLAVRIRTGETLQEFGPQ